MKTDKGHDAEDKILSAFDNETKKNIVHIINDSPSLVRLGDKEYMVKDMRYYSVFRIASLCNKMKESDASLDDDNKILTALCTDLDAMSEIMAIVLCNHLFTAEGENYDDTDYLRSRNDKMVERMKQKVMNSTYDVNQWAAIIVGAIKSIDLSGFFLLRKSVSSLMDSLTERKKKSEETVLRFMEAQSLQTQQTS